MKRTRYAAAMIFLTVVPGSYLALAQQTAPNAPPHAMTFFVTTASVGLGKGANLGGVAALTRTARCWLKP